MRFRRIQTIQQAFSRWHRMASTKKTTSTLILVLLYTANNLAAQTRDQSERGLAITSEQTRFLDDAVFFARLGHAKSIDAAMALIRNPFTIKMRHEVAGSFGLAVVPTATYLAEILVTGNSKSVTYKLTPSTHVGCLQEKHVLSKFRNELGTSEHVSQSRIAPVGSDKAEPASPPKTWRRTSGWVDGPSGYGIIVLSADSPKSIAEFDFYYLGEKACVWEARVTIALIAN
jgi:hypothetical protein